jgi:hypothetical protein
LPITFPRDIDRTPVASREQYPGVDGAVQYSEGIFVGYRGYQRLGIEPQYPFGYGLSYTSFAFSEPRLAQATIAANGSTKLSVDVTNTGKRAGDDDSLRQGLRCAGRFAGWFCGSSGGCERIRIGDCGSGRQGWADR